MPGAHSATAPLRPDAPLSFDDPRGARFGKVTLVPCPFESELLRLATFRLDLAVEADALVSQLAADALSGARAAGARLVSCRRPEYERQILSSLQAAGFRVIECLITLGRLAGPPGVRPAAVRLARREDAEQVAAIAAATFRTDRFHADPMIADDAADRLKATWARNSVMGRADTVFITESAGQVTGFNACVLRGSTATIDLIGVAPGFQGRGLGRDLVNASLSHYAEKTSRMTVGTQSVNTASLALYQSCGFRIEASALTLHAHLG